MSLSDQQSQQVPPPRATNLEEVFAIFEKIWAAESHAHALAFQPRPTDIIVATPAKSGTTWLQQIVHGLRTGGSMDFDEITDVTPYLEQALTVGWDLEAEQVAFPRVYKSHFDWRDVPKGGRYIVAFRNFVDAIGSAYRFFEGWFFEPGSISIDEFVRVFVPSETDTTDSYWHSVASWWPVRDNPEVLLLCYENMVADHPGAVRRIAQFMGITPDDPVVDIATRQSTREFMLAHRDQFDDSRLRRLYEERGWLPPPLMGDSFKVTPGATNESRYRISAELIAEIDEMWRKVVEPQTGLANHEALRAALL